MIAGMPLDTHGCGRPQVYTGCWPETSGFFFLSGDSPFRVAHKAASSRTSKWEKESQRTAWEKSHSLSVTHYHKWHPSHLPDSIHQDCGTNSSPPSGSGHTSRWCEELGAIVEAAYWMSLGCKLLTIIIQITTSLLNVLDTYRSGFRGVWLHWTLSATHSFLQWSSLIFCQHFSLRVFALPLFGCCFSRLPQALVTLPNFRFSPYSLHQVSLSPGFMYHWDEHFLSSHHVLDVLTLTILLGRIVYRLNSFESVTPGVYSHIIGSEDKHIRDFFWHHFCIKSDITCINRWGKNRPFRFIVFHFAFGTYDVV